MVTLDSLDLEKTSTEELGELLITAKKAYYTGGKPIMDDHTYDTLEDILLQKAPYHRLFKKVGHPNFDTGWAKRRHVMPMGSQNKVNNFKDLVHYFELKKVLPLLVKGGDKGGFIVQPKCDGISLEIIYKNGELVEAITRGDGEVGDLVTQNVVKMKNMVLNLPKNFSGSIRCEIMVTKEDFRKLNQLVKKDTPALSREGDGEGFYSNPRNAASGLSQRLDSKLSEYCSLYAVDLYPYPPTENDKINTLEKLGFTPVESHLFSDFSQIEILFQEFLTAKRLSYPFEIDGLIIKLNDTVLAQKLGSKNNRPKYQVAYKFPASSDSTQIKNIVWQVGPLGTITPVAEVEPIELSGAIVTFASLANHNLIKQKNINVGDIVKLSRRGDVIPHIESVITKVNSGHVTIPTHCPSCGTLLVVENKFLKCPNASNCLAQILGSLKLFCSTLEILGLSDKTIAKLYQAGRIRLPGDFYKLKPDDIATLDNLGDKSAKNIINQIQTKKTLTLKQVFDAAIIPNFSSQRIQQLITAGFDTPEKLLNLSTEQLLSLKGFQKTLAKKIIDGIVLRRSWIKSILSQVSIVETSLMTSLLNQTFVITGELSQPRKNLVDLIESNGGKVASTVSGNTSYLICNQPSNSDKYTTAVKLGIKIINESDFQKLL
ncbi:MAG: NAD-dependent DNA ligase LigA [Candidatus Shapirobacteria bacterium]|nr:NAD-dependent DNA ligase LigA [Candidatus Shapirobacteria bacterium]